jgi:hypothetical protein
VKRFLDAIEGIDRRLVIVLEHVHGGRKLPR